jgi:hypothetical protein
MKKTILMAAGFIAFTACNNDAKPTKGTGKEEQHDTHDGHKHQDGDGHQHDTTHKNDADTMGMKMGGNELDSKK